MSNSYTPPPPDRFREAASKGLRVFPAGARRKKPAIKWTQYQSQNPTEQDLARWDETDYNVCVVTGTPDGVVVLDVDSADAQRFVDDLDLPPTATVRTARGRHYYFRTPAEEIRNTVKLHGVKLDVRGLGGYVIGAGSTHPDGSLYRWESSPEDVGFAPVPPQLLALLPQSKPRGSARKAWPSASTMPSAGVERAIHHALRDARQELSEAAEGKRNDTLFKVSARMARYVAAARSEWEPIAAALTESAEAIGLGECEIAPTIESGWKAGSSAPAPWVRTAAEYIYLANQDCFHHLESGKDLKRDGFNGQHGHEYGGKGSFANYLLNAGYVRKVFDLTYEPLRDDRLIERDGLEFLNTFRPSSVVAVEGDPAPFIDFMERLVPEAEEREHLIKMIAYTVRNPGRKLRYALLFRTAIQGVGKSMLASIWGELLGSHNVRKTGSKELSSDFQSFLRETLLVVCEELNLGMGPKVYNDIKDMITADTALINEKYMKQREWPVYATMVFFTNLEKPILIEPSDRRIFFIDSPAPKRSPDYYRQFSAWWGSNLGVIRAYLDAVDLEGFDPYRAPPMTEAKIKLIEGSGSELAQDLRWAIRERQGVFERDLVTLQQVAFEIGSKVSARQLAKALKEIGAVSIGQQRVGTTRASLWVIRNTDYWPYADGEVRLREMETQGGGIFSQLDGIVEVVHLKAADNVAMLVAGSEKEFGLPDPSA